MEFLRMETFYDGRNPLWFQLFVTVFVKQWLFKPELSAIGKIFIFHVYFKITSLIQHILYYNDNISTLTHSWFPANCLQLVMRPFQSLRSLCCSSHPGEGSLASGLCDWSYTDRKCTVTVGHQSATQNSEKISTLSAAHSLNFECFCTNEAYSHIQKGRFLKITDCTTLI